MSGAAVGYKLKVVVSGDDDEIDGAVLDWAGRRRLWDSNPDLHDNYSVISDVVEYCTSAYVDREEYDLGRPGGSGYNYSISTPNKRKLKAEIHARLTELLKLGPDA
jgi:hypothetical protein